MIEKNTFAEACYDQNSLDELLEAYYSGKADQTDCDVWNIDDQQWLDQIGVALAQKIRDFLLDNETPALVGLINEWAISLFDPASGTHLYIADTGEIEACNHSQKKTLPLYQVAAFFKTQTPHKMGDAKQTQEILILDESEIPASFDATTLFLNGKAILEANEVIDLSPEDVDHIASNLSEALGGVPVKNAKIDLRGLAAVCAEGRGEIEQFNKDIALAEDEKGDVDIDDSLDAWTQGYTNANAYQAYLNSLEK